MSKVFFITVSDSDVPAAVGEKLSRLLDESRVLSVISKGDEVAVKMHFGEEGNTGHVRAQYAGIICKRIAEIKGRPFLTDTNTLYRGMRTNCKDHIAVAHKHGFTKEACGADIIIPDDKKSKIADVAVNGRFIKDAKVFDLFLKAGAITGIAHFKGHLMTGFGGALKNIGMGCASREGKLAQHSEVAPIVYAQRCKQCLSCIKACPADAISLKAHRIFIDSSKCIGCSSCIAACKYNAIDVDWEATGDKVSEKMVEYTSAVLKDKKHKSAFINFAVKITKECDCLAKDDPRVCPDIGIFASNDPVSVDKACLDSVIGSCGKDIFKILHPRRDGLKQLRHAQELGLGDLEYELVKLK